MAFERERGDEKSPWTPSMDQETLGGRRVGVVPGRSVLLARRFVRAWLITARTGGHGEQNDNV